MLTISRESSDPQKADWFQKMSGENEEPHNKPWRPLMVLWRSGRRTSLLDCPGTLGGDCGGREKGLEKCVWHRVCTSAASNPAHLSLKDEDLGAITWESEALGNFRGELWKGEKRPEGRVHSLANYRVLTASYMPEPAPVSALCAIHGAVVFMEPLERGDSWHTEPKERNTNYSPLRRAVYGENKQGSVTVVVCRAFFKLSGQEKMWAETWVTRIESQPFEGNFWSEGIAAPKRKEACVAGSQRWGRWGNRGRSCGGLQAVAEGEWWEYRAVGSQEGSGLALTPGEEEQLVCPPSSVVDAPFFKPVTIFTPV